jgi:hypothetical protein
MERSNGACCFGSYIDLGCFNGSRGFDQVGIIAITCTEQDTKTGDTDCQVFRCRVHDVFLLGFGYRFWLLNSFAKHLPGCVNLFHDIEPAVT